MSKPFDATSKALLELRPADWPAFLGVPARTVEVVDADVSTVTAAADKVLLVRADEGDRVQHFDFQVGPDASLPRRIHGYSALLEDRHELPVDSVVVLLRPEANLKAINGRYQRRLPGAARPYLSFRYRVLRVWKLPVQAVLRAGISVLPLAPICAVRQNELPGVIQRMRQRLDAEAEPTTAAELWTATKVLLGLRYEAALIDRLLQRVRVMKESTTYQAIVDEGRVQQARDDVRRLGERKFKSRLPARLKVRLDSITDSEQLQQLLEHILDVGNWDELLATATDQAPPRQTRRK